MQRTRQQKLSGSKTAICLGITTPKTAIEHGGEYTHDKGFTDL
jgi:hypothetical protein